MKIKYLLAPLAACAMSATAQAQILVQYAFTSGSAAPTTTVGNTTPGNAAWTGLSGASFSSSGGTAFAPSPGVNGSGGVLGSLQTGAYLSFTISAAAGYSLNLEELTFNLGATNPAGSGTSYTVNANVRSSLDGFSANLMTTAGTSTATPGTTQYSSVSTDLTATTFNNLSSITFRLYPWDNQNNSNMFFRYDDVTLEGAVTAVPEPSTAALLSIGLLVLTRNFRKRK